MKIKSILTEIDNISTTSKNKNLLVESRSNHLIVSALNLLEFIEVNYDEETSKVLERKLINAIKTKNSEKFLKAVKSTLDES